jgi:hypothetical protein
MPLAKNRGRFFVSNPPENVIKWFNAQKSQAFQPPGNRGKSSTALEGERHFSKITPAAKKQKGHAC